MTDFFWSTPSGESHDVRTEDGGTVEVFPKVVSAIAADAGNFVWADPTSVQAGNVYNNWPDLAAAIALVRGQKTVTIVFANPTITAGAWPDITDVTFLAGETTPLGVVLTIANGATLTAVHKLTFDGVAVVYADAAVPCISLSGSQLLEVNLKDEGQISQSGGQPFVSLAGTSTLVSFASPGVWAAGTIAVAAVGATVDLFLFNGATLGAGAVTATALGTVNLAVDGASQSGLSGTAVGTITPSIQLLDPQPTFVFRPGASGITDGNVFTTWATLMAAVSLSTGPKTIYVDDNLAAAHATAGTWNVDLCTFVGNFNTSSTETLIIDDQCVWQFAQIWIDGGLTVNLAAASTTPCLTLTGANFAAINLRGDSSSLKALGAHPFALLQDTSALVVQLYERTSIGDGTHNVVSVGATATCAVDAISVVGPSGNCMLPHALGGTGTGTILYTAESNPSLTQDVTTFTPTYAVAPNTTQASGNSGTGTGTVTVTTGNISKKTSGKVLVIATLAGTTSAGTTVTGQLVRDAATNIGNASVATTLSAGDGFELCIAFVDTLPDFATHTYTLSATAGAGNITPGGANSAQITCVELN